MIHTSQTYYSNEIRSIKEEIRVLKEQYVLLYLDWMKGLVKDHEMHSKREAIRNELFDKQEELSKYCMREKALEKNKARNDREE